MWLSRTQWCILYLSLFISKQPIVAFFPLLIILFAKWLFFFFFWVHNGLNMPHTQVCRQKNLSEKYHLHSFVWFSVLLRYFCFYLFWTKHWNSFILDSIPLYVYTTVCPFSSYFQPLVILNKSAIIFWKVLICFG